MSRSLKLSLQKCTYATATKSKVVPKKTTSDKRYQIIQAMLYGNNTHRMLPVLYNNGREQHEIIERLWCLEKEKEAVELKRRLQNKYVSMRLAIEALESMNKRMFDEAIKKDVQFQQFPLKMRVPTETLPVENWDEQTKMSKRKM